MTFTFVEIKKFLVEKLKSLAEWKNTILEIGVYSSILSAFSYSSEKIALYVDSLFIETTENAQLYSSHISQSKFLGYKPLRKTGAEGILIVSSDPTFSMLDLVYSGVLTFIKKGTVILSEKDTTVSFYTEEDSQINSGVVQKVRSTISGANVSFISDTLVGIPCSNHGFSNGDKIYITRTRFYNGIYKVLSTSTINLIHIESSYTAERLTGNEIIYSGQLFIPVKSGIKREFNYIGLGEINESIQIFSNDVDEKNVSVYFKNNLGEYEELQLSSDLYFSPDISVYRYEISNFEDYTGINITFGDGLTSKKVSTGDEFLVVYYETTGLSSNVSGLNVLNVFENPLLDINESISDLYCTNLDILSGGRDLETIDNIVKNSRVSRNSGSQINNRTSWVNFINSYNFIKKGIVWTEQDLGNYATTGLPSQNVHYMTAITKEGFTLSNTQEDLILADIENLKDPADVALLRKCKINRLKFIVTATIKNNISIKQAQDAVISALTNDYSIDKMDFQQEINKSNYISTIDNLKSIVIRNTAECYYAEENATTSSPLKPILNSLISSDSKKSIILITNTFEIWLRRKIDLVWQSPVKIAQTLNGINILGINTFNVYGQVSGNTRLYQCFDLISDVVPSITKTGTSSDSSIVLTVSDTTNIKLGMYVTGLNLDSDSQVVDIVNSTTIKLNKPTLPLGASTGNVSFCIWNDIGLSFGVANPTGTDDKGFILYLVYRTKDGQGNRVGDIRLSSFDSISVFEESLIEWNLSYA